LGALASLPAGAHPKYNFPQTQLWRALGATHPYTIIHPLTAVQPNPAPRYWHTGITGELYPTYYHRYYKEFISRDNERIVEAVNRSYGKVFRVYGAWQIGLHYTLKNPRLVWEQYYHYVYAGIFHLKNKVDTHFQALYVNAKGFTTSVAYTFSPLPSTPDEVKPWSALHRLKGTLRFGRARYLYEDDYNAVDFFERRLRFNLKRYPWHFYFNLDVEYRYPVPFLASSEILLQVQNISLGHNLHSAQAFVGLKSFNLLRSFSARAYIPYSFKLFTGIAPTFEGDYLRQQTFIAGSEIFFLPQLRLDFFLQDKGYPGGAIYWQGKYGNLQIYTYQQDYDKYRIYKYRNYGLNLNLDWPWQSS
ncbi:MAG: hypothetical protein J6Y94_00855, partial [Bacteriovoracaceae bacterium]|nr:hypothetical protein [Bacteriovoracaceae bacterium]